jgi:hypothetical protein
MDCIKCPATNVCTVAEMIRKHSLQMDITVVNCKIKDGLKDSSKECCDMSAIVPEPIPLKQYKDFRQASNELRDKEKGADCKIKISTDTTGTESALEKVQCPTCGGITTSDDISICDGEGCSKPVCSNCGTEVNGKRYCEKCWNKM